MEYSADKRELPFEILLHISGFADKSSLRALCRVNTLWRYICLPSVWSKIEISDWENVTSPQMLHEQYGRYVTAIEYRRNFRRRGTPDNATTVQHAFPAPACGAKTKTEIICEWLSMRWDYIQQVAIGAWPPYNVQRIQAAIAASCPCLQVLVLEGAADSWLDTLQRSVTIHKQLHQLHVSEDPRALLSPTPDSPYRRLSLLGSFNANTSATSLTHITLPCMAGSVDYLLGKLPQLLPALKSLDLRQFDFGIASRLYINIPQELKELRISGRYPLSIRMFCPCQKSATQSSGSLGFRHCCRNNIQLHMLSKGLHSLSVTGMRTEEAARREAHQFWTIIFQHIWKSLLNLVVPVACPETSALIEQNCRGLQSLRISHAGSFIVPKENDLWVARLLGLPHLRSLDVASSNNEYEGCCLTSLLVTDHPWNMQWLHTLYTSRLVLSTDTLQMLLGLLPYLHTLWFTFNAKDNTVSSKTATTDKVCAPFSSRIRYLIVNSIYTEADNEDDALFSVLGSASHFEDDYKAQRKTLSLLDCLTHLPTLRRCRLPMFTFPDEQRRYLQSRLSYIEFRRYAPPY